MILSFDKPVSELRITIIGLGLIGGSLAKAFRERAGITDITAVDSDCSVIEKAMADGVISRGFKHLDKASGGINSPVSSPVLKSDIIFLCTTVNKSVEYIELLADRVKPGCLITDVGSTKGEIIKSVEGHPRKPLFIGGHPMTGSEKAGYNSSSSHMFENAYYILTPCSSTPQKATEIMSDLLSSIGALPVIMDASEHDMVAGGISHIPHITASLLVNLAKELDTPDGKMKKLAAGGFRDITRISSSCPELWESIVFSNKEQILQLLSRLSDKLSEFDLKLKSGDREWIRGFFRSAREYRDSLTDGPKGLISSEYSIAVDVADKPGIIGKLATILGANGINIKNIHVAHSREMEGGCIIISLPDSKSAAKAAQLLSANGYEAHLKK